jgi:U3 small nucleolar RNA-associated protein 25
MRGTVKVARREPGSISRVVLKVQQVFHKLDCNDIEAVDDARFKYFTQKVTQVSPGVAAVKNKQSHDPRCTQQIYPQLKASVSKHVFIFFPSYFDYVRVRNFMKEDPDDPSFCLCCE